MTIDIDNWVGECDKCQRKGKPLAAVLPLENIKVSAVWELSTHPRSRLPFACCMEGRPFFLLNYLCMCRCP
uniref:Uncharacterized protein n=1 Tax=Knipowitschia caucasica TaxID=637954 RepID=A0AAV2KUZ6_KNICA